jgi:signal transduction histidine kinase
MVHIVISDTGCGISPEHIKKIFDKFYRVKKHTDEDHAGAGLGLSIAESIAKAHRGSISITSQEKRGTSVTVILPAYT